MDAEEEKEEQEEEKSITSKFGINTSEEMLSS